MSLRGCRGRAWLLGAAALLLPGGCCGSSSHTLRFFCTCIPEPGPGLPWFVIVGYVDDQPFMHYDSHSKRAKTRAPWMEQAGQEDPQYWERETEYWHSSEATSRVGLQILQHHVHQSAEFQTWQVMFGCELSEDRPSKGYLRYGYNMRDFLIFHKETLIWTAAVDSAKEAKRILEAEPEIALSWKVELEEICTERLRKYLDYGREALQRKEPPLVKVTRKDSHEGLETLLCQAHGFYPKEINATWRKDGEVREGDTFRGVVSPNADGTYYIWLSVEIEPQERSRYQCHVEHDGLQEPLDMAVEESASLPAWLTAVGIVLGVLVSLLLVAGAIILLKKRPKEAAYRAASASDLGSNSSNTASSPLGV